MNVLLLSGASKQDIAWARHFLSNEFHGIEFRHVHLSRPTNGRLRVEKKQIEDIRRAFPFVFLAMPYRINAVESVARKLSIPCAAVTQAPHPVQAWVLSSWWNAALPDEGDVELFPSGDLLYLLPKDHGYVERFTPLLGKNTEHLYRDDIHKILVPINESMIRTCARVCQAGLGQWIAERLPRHKEAAFFLAPMDADAISIIPEIPESDRIFWLGGNAVTNRLLSLLDKADAVLAHDDASALLPTLMERKCITEASVGRGVASCLTGVNDYISGGFRSNFQVVRSRFIHHYLKHGLISEKCFTAEHLKNLIQEYRHDLRINVNWDCHVRQCWQTSNARKTSSTRKKLRKLFRDPYKYCDDSKNRFVRFCRVLFKE